MKIEWDERTCVTVVMASGGYPEKYETGKIISGLEQVAKLNDVQCFMQGRRGRMAILLLLADACSR